MEPESILRLVFLSIDLKGKGDSEEGEVTFSLFLLLPGKKSTRNSLHEFKFKNSKSRRSNRF